MDFFRHLSFVTAQVTHFTWMISPPSYIRYLMITSGGPRLVLSIIHSVYLSFQPLLRNGPIAYSSMAINWTGRNKR